MFRCMLGLQQETKTKIRVEPGLFEWTKWVSGTSLPVWIPPTELAAANLNVDTTYRYTNPIASRHLHLWFYNLILTSYIYCFVPRPHIPVSKLTVSESYDTYISRSFQVTREILTDSKNLGNGVQIIGSIHYNASSFIEMITLKCFPFFLCVMQSLEAMSMS